MDEWHGIAGLYLMFKSLNYILFRSFVCDLLSVESSGITRADPAPSFVLSLNHIRRRLPSQTATA